MAYSHSLTRWSPILCAIGLALFLTGMSLAGVNINVWTLFYVFAVPARGQSNTCPVFGTDQSTELSPSMETGLFLNFEAPSQCRGRVTSWEVCRYGSTCGDGDSSRRRRSDAQDDNNNCRYEASFVVYRRSSSGNYELVPESTTEWILSNDVSQFGCFTVSPDQNFEIQENDVVGACVGSVNPLYLVGDTNDDNANKRLYRVINDCTMAQLAATNIGYEQRNAYKLHLYANTGIKTPSSKFLKLN